VALNAVSASFAMPCSSSIAPYNSRAGASGPGVTVAFSALSSASAPIAAVPLGIARAALDGVRELSASKIARISPAVLREKPVVQGAVGRAEAALPAARAFLFEACNEAWSTVASGAELTLEQRAVLRLSCAQVADAAKSVVQIAYDIGGGTSVYESCPLQRCCRDTYAAVQHVQVQGGNFETVGRVLLGLDTGTSIL
jgi:indole-3-acetate monooxygenase